MKNKSDDQFASLRLRAEAVLSASPTDVPKFDQIGIKRLVQDLRMHQAELEIQNEELRQSRVELELARDSYARLYNQSPVGYLTLEAGGTILKANQTFLDMTGFPGELAGNSFANCIVPGDRSVFLGRYSAFYRQPDGKSLELSIEAKDGPLAVRCTGRRMNEGAHLLLAIVDMSGEVLAQEARREAEQLWGQTFEAMSDAVWLLDLDGKILKFNSASERITGIPKSGMDGCLCYELMHGCKLRPDDCPYLRMKRSFSHESWMFQSGDRWFEVTVDPLRNGDGRIVGSVHITKDISERKRSEDRIRDLLKDKDLLLKEVHHRIKNNMSVIAALLSLQASRMDDSAAGTALEEARSRVVSMMIIYDKLYRSKDFRTVSAADYLSQLLEEIISQFPSLSRVRVEQEFADFPLGSAVMFPLGIIVNELLTNAFKYAFPDERSGIISVSLVRESDSTALICVSDNGVGLPEGLEPTRSSGFGFLLVRSLAEQIGGSFEYGNSAPDGGASFSVRFKVS